MIKVERLYPFDYYAIERANQSTNSLIGKIASNSLNLIENLFKILANAVIGCANLLQLYRLTKVEIVASRPPQMIAENQVLASYSFLFSKVAQAIIGTGRASNFGTEMTKFFQAPDRNFVGLIKNRVTLKLLGENRVNKALKVINVALQTMSTIQLLGFMIYIMPFSSYLPFQNQASGLMALVNSPYKNSYIKVPLSLWGTYSIMKKSAEGIKTCYDNAYKNPVEAAKLAGLHTVNIIAAIAALKYSFEE